MSRLEDAIIRQDYELLKEALEGKPFLDNLIRQPESQFAFNALTCSVIGNNMLFVLAILAAGANVNAINFDGSTALTHASSAEFTQTLVEHGALVCKEQPEDGSTSLHFAAEEGRADQLETLITKSDGLQLLESFDYVSRTPLACAAQRGHFQAIETLVRHGANLNASDPSRPNSTPLQLAIEAGLEGTARLLLKLGADPHFRIMGPLPKELAQNVGLTSLAQEL